MSIERDETFVPRTRTDYNLPPESSARPSDYHEIFEETPIYTLFRMLFMQVLGLQFYLFTNALGSPKYPPGTNVSHRILYVFAADINGNPIALPPILSTF
jgi:omega-6 fatty acid desaturase (delta-12 desaturase)